MVTTKCFACEKEHEIEIPRFRCKECGDKWLKKKLFGIEKPFDCYFWFGGWDSISLGLHFSFKAKNIEIHLPFGFIRFGKPFK